MASMDLEDYIVTKFAQVIRSWAPELARDIYALSLYRDDNKVPYRPAVYLAYNTRSHLMNASPEARASGEARWNLAYWPQDYYGIEDKRSQYVQALHVDDREGTRALHAWLNTITEGKPDDIDADIVLPLFAALCVQVARRLHDDGVIREVFGWNVPIIMHDDEWDDDMLRNTEAANPPGAADEFLSEETRWTPAG